MKVEVPDEREPKTSKNPSMMVEVALPLLPLMYTLPLTASCADPGEVVPMPTLPLESMMNAVEVAYPGVVVAIRRSGVVMFAAFAMESFAAGVVEPMPRKEFAASTVRKLMESIAVADE